MLQRYQGVVSGARSFGSRVALALLASLSIVGAASAQDTAAVDFDPAPVLAIVTSATTFITTVGLAVLVMLMVAKGIKWARKAG